MQIQINAATRLKAAVNLKKLAQDLTKNEHLSEFGWIKSAIANLAKGKSGVTADAIAKELLKGFPGEVTLGKDIQANKPKATKLVKLLLDAYNNADALVAEREKALTADVDAKIAALQTRREKLLVKEGFAKDHEGALPEPLLGKIETIDDQLSKLRTQRSKLLRKR